MRGKNQAEIPLVARDELGKLNTTYNRCYLGANLEGRLQAASGFATSSEGGVIGSWVTGKDTDGDGFVRQFVELAILYVREWVCLAENKPSRDVIGVNCRYSRVR